MSENIKNQSIHLITYGDSNYTLSKERLKMQAEKTGWFSSITLYGPENLSPEFANKHKNVLTMKRGGGYWIWKYDIITQKLAEIKDDDILIFLDSGCSINVNGKKRLDEYIEMLNNDAKQTGILSFDNGCIEKIWTTKQILDYFAVIEDPNITETGQLVGGILVMKKSSHLKLLLEKYNDVLDENNLLFTDHYNNENQSEYFKDNRHDQSIFSIIRKKNCPTSLILHDETWWKDNDFSCEQAQKSPFWATRISDAMINKSNSQSNSKIIIGSEGMGSYGKQVIGSLLKTMAPRVNIIFENRADCNVIVKSHFLNEEPLWNQEKRPYILWSGEAYSQPVPPNASKHIYMVSTLTDPRDPYSIYIPYVLHSPYLYRNKLYENVERPYLLAYCSSNPVILREILFDKFVELAGEEKCHALGKCHGSHPGTQRKIDGTWESDALIEAYKNYKFVFAMENRKVPGYVTEKIMNAFYSGAIPIYWGSDNISQLFNKKAFINLGDFNCLADCVNHCISMTDDECANMLAEPIYNPDSELIHLLDTDYNQKRKNNTLLMYIQKFGRFLSNQ